MSYRPGQNSLSCKWHANSFQEIAMPINHEQINSVPNELTKRAIVFSDKIMSLAGAIGHLCARKHHQGDIATAKEPKHETKAGVQ
jgi:hypothetical protein